MARWCWKARKKERMRRTWCAGCGRRKRTARCARRRGDRRITARRGSRGSLSFFGEPRSGRSDVSEAQAEAELDLALAIEVGGVDVERLAESGGVGFEAGEEVERGQLAVDGAGLDIVAGGFKLGDVLVVEEVEALGQQLERTHGSEIEALAQTQIGFPSSRIAEGVAAYAVDAIVAARAVHAGAEADDGRAGVDIELLGDGAGGAHGEGQTAAIVGDAGEHPAIAEERGEAAAAADFPRRLKDDHGRGGVAHVEIAGAVLERKIGGIEDVAAGNERGFVRVPIPRVSVGIVPVQAEAAAAVALDAKDCGFVSGVGAIGDLGDLLIVLVEAAAET